MLIANNSVVSGSINQQLLDAILDAMDAFPLATISVRLSPDALMSFIALK